MNYCDACAVAPTRARQTLGMTVIDQVGGPDSTHEDFVEALPDDAPRFAVMDKVYINKDDCHFDKIVFILYNPRSGHASRYQCHDHAFQWSEFFLL